MRWLLSLVILTPSSCYSYQNYHWQAGFPTPLTGVGQDLVQAQGAFLLKQQDYLQRRLGQVQPMIRWVARQVEARQLPALLSFVPLIESSYRLDVVSHAGAAGPWQLMPQTASRFGVPINDSFDGRYSLPLATDAALTYLAWLHRLFDGDWPLALAAYNAGEGRVTRAILAANSRNLWDLPLPEETHLYVARLLALSRVLQHPQRYGFVLPPWRQGAELQIVSAPQGCSLLAWALEKGVSMNDASRWNPAWRLPQAQGVSRCPIAYSQSEGRQPGEEKLVRKGPFIASTISLESLHDPLLLKASKGLDLGRGGIRLERLPDPLGLDRPAAPLLP